MANRFFNKILTSLEDIGTITILERSESDQNWNIHSKKHSYLDTLHMAIKLELQDYSNSHNITNSKTVTYNDDMIQGYNVIIGQFIKAGIKTKYIEPDITITLDSASIDDMTLTMWKGYMQDSNIIQKYKICNGQDFMTAKHSITDYFRNGSGSWIFHQ